MDVKYLLLAAIAGSSLTACSNDDILVVGADAGDAAVVEGGTQTDVASTADAADTIDATLTDGTLPDDAAVAIDAAQTDVGAPSDAALGVDAAQTDVASPIDAAGDPAITPTLSDAAWGGDTVTDAVSKGGVEYDIVATFREPMTQPHDTIFTGSFTFDPIGRSVSYLSGSLTESMTVTDGGHGGPMATVPLRYQLSSVPVAIAGADGLLVTTFALTTTDTFAEGGFAPGGTQYYGLLEHQANNHNAYAMVFINLADPTATPTQSQLDKLAYADCTAGGIMGSTCMTGTTVAGYGHAGTMGGYPVSQVITRR